MDRKTALVALYDRDFQEWTRRNSELLRQGCFAEADIAHIAEEIEDMGKRDVRELESRITQILQHRLKIYYSLGQSENDAHWLREISDQQGEIEVLLDQSPSLEPRIESLVSRAYRRARKSFVEEYSGRMNQPPDVCPWQVKDIIGGE
jgi:hypothetical protein